MDPLNSKLKVLFIDDEPLHLDLLKRIINSIDPMLFIDLLVDPTKAIEMVLKNEYDCIVLDEKMPMVSGMDIIKMIKHVKDVPCIIYTGYGIDEMSMEANKSGADMVLQKILNASFYPKLITAIRETVHKHNG